MGLMLIALSVLAFTLGDIFDSPSLFGIGIGLGFSAGLFYGYA